MSLLSSSPKTIGMEKGMDSYKGGSVGEVRRINVVYFLSRGGRTDHPHLFRVSHLHRAGVRLRDVKRWLSELRGKDMPENFSWSYKRKYKAGYVWQDLMDDDLITPVSDNEYVLKGCDVRGGTPPPCADAPKENSSSLDDQKKLNGQEEKAVCDQKQQVEEVLQVTTDSDESFPKPPPPIDQDSPGAGEGESAHRKIPFKIDLSQDLQEQKQQQQQQEVEKKAVIKAVVARAAEEEQVQGAPGSKKNPVGMARRMRVAKVLHNILTCCAADADDAALRPILRQRAGAGDDWPRAPVCPGIDGCGLHMSRKARLRGGGKDKAKRDGRDAHKPASLPRCSQCGKEFKPQELHSHMQSCRGFRERMRSSASARISVDRNRNSTAGPEHRRSKADYSPERPSSTFLLTES